MKMDAMRFIICLLFSITAFSQSKPIELKIDSINISSIEDKERMYSIHYHLTNLSDKAISFVLNTKSIIPINGGSLRPYPYYKIYENDKSFDASGIFFSKNTQISFNDEKALKKYQDSIINTFKNKTVEQLLQKKKENFLNNIQHLKPKETLNCIAVLYWDKKRYFKNDAIEYYIEEKEPYSIELHVNLMKEELLLDFSEEERNEILKDLNLTKGWFSSNKVLIDFSE